MTYNKLRVIVLFVLTVCIVISDVKCSTRKECRKQIFITNHMITLLNDDQKFKLVEYFINEYKYEGIAEFIYPPDDEFLESEDDDAPIYHTIYLNERAFQLELVQILGFQRPRFTGTGSYNTAVMMRRNVINSTFLFILNDRLKNVQMCVNNESIKCPLIGLINRAPYYELRNKHECTDNGDCVITVDEYLEAPDQIMQCDEKLINKFRDQFDPTQTCYKTYVEDPARKVFVDWKQERYIEEIVQSPPSD